MFIVKFCVGKNITVVCLFEFIHTSSDGVAIKPLRSLWRRPLLICVLLLYFSILLFYLSINRKIIHDNSKYYTVCSHFNKSGFDLFITFIHSLIVK